MKKQLQHRLRQAGLAALALAAIVAVDGGQMGKAEAGVRIDARLKTPHVSVHYRSGPRTARVHRPFVYRITQRDRAIARRLAYQTGHRRIVLLDLRSRGLTWRQIGRRLDIPPRLVRLAVHANHHKVVRRGRGHSRCGNGWR
jgi:DNA-binding NarL/FixJ family response regulator